MKPRTKIKAAPYLKNRLLIPIGKDNDLYFPLLDKFKDSIGGVYIGWPGIASGREAQDPSRKFFDKIYRWCLKNGKVFDILFNASPVIFGKKFDAGSIKLKPYRNEITELTFRSTMLMKEEVFAGFKKNISVTARIDSISKLHALKKDNWDLQGAVLDRDINRNSRLVNEIIDYASRLNIHSDILVNEGCIPFCPNMEDHGSFTALAHYSDKREQIETAMKICTNKFYVDPASLLKSPFLTRESLPFYNARFFKLCDRAMYVPMLEDVLNYYVYGEPMDMGVVFSVVKTATGLTTDMLPAAFHKRILACKNECYKCKACDATYESLRAVSHE